jgi:hypothetical protein
MTERELQAVIVDLAHVMGWTCAHFRPAQNSRGIWRTPVGADGAGFPDLVLIRPGQCIVVEVKSAEGRVTPEQRAWLSGFEAAGVPSYVWRPDSWPGAVLAVLSREAVA